MSELSIKITIAGRVYPLTIERADEENIRLAAKNIDQRIQLLKDQYSVQEKQDLLAMTALQFATENLNLMREGGEQLAGNLESINQRLDLLLEQK